MIIIRRNCCSQQSEGFSPETDQIILLKKYLFNEGHIGDYFFTVFLDS